MTWIAIFILMAFSIQAVGAQEVYHPVVVQPKADNPRFEPNCIEMRTAALHFLIGTWTYNDEKVHIVETWTKSQLGDVIGMRERFGKGMKLETDEVYDFFCTYGGTLRVRQMNFYLQDIGLKNGSAFCMSEVSNKVSIILEEGAPCHAPVVKMNYVSPNDEELDLEIVTKKNGTESKEAYKLRRAR